MSETASVQTPEAYPGEKVDIARRNDEARLQEKCRHT